MSKGNKGTGAGKATVGRPGKIKVYRQNVGGVGTVGRMRPVKVGRNKKTK